MNIIQAKQKYRDEYECSSEFYRDIDAIKEAIKDSPKGSTITVTPSIKLPVLEEYLDINDIAAIRDDSYLFVAETLADVISYYEKM